MADGSFQIVEFIEQLDSSVKAHMDWARHVLRCSVLHESPGEDVLAPLAHTLCGFSRWFSTNKTRFDDLSPQKTAKLESVHQSMHDAIRSICTAILAGQPGSRSDVERFEQSQGELIELMAQFKTLFLVNAARYDTLTGLRLRAGIESEFVQIQKVCRRNSVQLYAAIIDVDHFKQINDHYGHSVGDVALRHLADTLKGVVRPDEPLIRWGGEEFLILLPGASLPVASKLANRLRQEISAASLASVGQVTLSFGVAESAPDEPTASLLDRVDKALYAAKSLGRNRVEVAQPAA